MAVAKTYNQILTKGLQSSLATTPIEDGKLRYTTDSGRLFMDNGNARIEITDIEKSYTQAQILSLQTVYQKIYIASDTGRAYFKIGNTWHYLGENALTSSSEDADKVIWISDTSDKEPEYNSSFTYNPNDGVLKVPKLEVSSTSQIGDLIITDNEDSVTGYHTVDFAFA